MVTSGSSSRERPNGLSPEYPTDDLPSRAVARKVPVEGWTLMLAAAIFRASPRRPPSGSAVIENKVHGPSARSQLALASIAMPDHCLTELVVALHHQRLPINPSRPGAC